MKVLSKRFSPQEYEEEILRFWKDNEIYDKLRRSLSCGKKFYFLDGPPYPSSGEPHPGTCWNKFIKDVVVRYWRSKGYNVRDQPGWDTHGLPIEVTVEKNLGFRTKKDIERYGIDRFVEKCRELALNNLSEMTKKFERLGVSLDWRNPYLTLRRSYINSAWWGFKRIWESGRLKRGLKVVHWCPRCETVLSDYEVHEYQVLTDPSIYVKFPVEDDENTFILIWTTTPWTLPANVAVMVHPDEDYVKVEVVDEVLILAERRLEHVMSEAGVGEYQVVEKLKGRDLEGLKYRNPLEEEVPVQAEVEHKVVLSDKYVTMDEGTGCVHSAPGHGKEDYEVAHRDYGMPVLSPVDDKGVFTEEAGRYDGMFIKDANRLIVEDLRRKGFLFHEGKITHRYPVCWRCKSPLIIRATEQWYVQLSDLKDGLIEEISKVRWVPAWGGEKRFKNWLMELEDWIISRQRYWGTPLPVWLCGKCGHVEVIGGEEELKEKSGKVPEDLHKPWVDEIIWSCPKCGGLMRRVPDVADVWYDSGVAFFASLEYPKSDEYEKLRPVDFIVEGHDQFRGWFFSLLRMGYLIFGSAPYRTVMSHGFMLDERGEEMHKSKGNYVPVGVILERYGADVFRVFVLSKVPWSDLRFTWFGMDEARRKLNVVWNVYVFITEYARISGEIAPKSEDRWILSRLNSMIRNVDESLSSYRLHDALNEFLNFMVDDLSHLYLRVVRKRIKSDPTVSKILRDITAKTLPILAIFAPLMAEKIYQEAFRGERDPESVVMLRFPGVDVSSIDKNLEFKMELAKKVITVVNSMRTNNKLKIRQPLPELVITGDLVEARVFRDVIASETNVKSVRFLDNFELTSSHWVDAGLSEGRIYLNVELTEELKKEGFAREIIRRIQQMRKEMGLRKGVEKVEVYIDGCEREDLGDLISDIMNEVDAVLLEFGRAPKGCYHKDWRVGERRISIWLRRLE